MEKVLRIRRWLPWLPAILLALVMIYWESTRMPPDFEPISPMRSIEVRISRSDRNHFTAQMRKFAETHGFTSLIKPGTPDPDDIFFQLWRDNIDLLATKSSDVDPPDLEFLVAFYRQRFKSPPSQTDINLLMESLKRLLEDIPGVRITERQK